jgi:tetratricopeptide (TPR) repeat protein
MVVLHYIQIMYIDILEQTKGSLKIILYLNEKGRTEISSIIEDNGIPRQTCYTALEKLEEAGLLFTSRERTFPPKVFCKLTMKGTEVAEHLAEADDSLGTTIEGYKRQLSELKRKGRSSKEYNEYLLSLLKNLENECFICGKWDEALTYGKKIVKIARRIHDYEVLAGALRKVGRIQLNRQKFDDARSYFQKSLRAAHKVSDFKNIALDNYNIGTLHERKGDISRALVFYERCEEYARVAGSDLEMGRAYLGKGRILFRKGRFKESIVPMMKAVKIFERIGSTEDLPKAYTTLGSSEYYIDTDNALKWHEKCIKVSEGMGNLRMLGYGLSNAAGCYIQKGELAKAKRYLDRAIPIFKGLGEKSMVSSILTKQARIFRLKKQWREAREYLSKAMGIAKAIGVPAQVADVHFQYGLLYKDRGIEAKARRYLKSSLRIYRVLGEQDMTDKVENELGQLMTP